MSLPCKECGGQCCTFPVFQKKEYKFIAKRYGIPVHTQIEDIGDAKVLFIRESGNCPYLNSGRCSIYNHRPQVCKEYGINPMLPCQYLFPDKAKALNESRMK